jgi:glycosyltransferase involved in cell wall biosynthesis
MRKLRLAVVARLDDHKLASKLRPLAALPEVEDLALVRRTPLELAGIRSLCPPAAVAGLAPLAEPWRLLSLLRVLSGWPRKDSFVLSFFLMPHALLADVARRLLGVRTVPVALSQEDVDLAIGHPLVRRAVLAAHAVGVRGGHSRRRLVDAGFDAARLFEPPNVHELAGFEPAEPGRADLDVVFVGGLVPVKQVDLLLRSLALVKQERPALRAAIVGDGELGASLRTLARELGLLPNVEFVGALRPAEVAAWLRRARVFAMTSKVEGLPMAMIEALSCGVPVVLPDVGDVTTVAEDGKNASIVRTPTVEGYAEAIGGLLRDEVRRSWLAQGAIGLRERFRAEYSLEAAQRVWRRALLGDGE